MARYDHRAIEARWQDHWEVEQTYKVSEAPDRPKYYVLDMFPYPSGAGLHVGHLVGYTATDIIVRYKRMKGFNVLHPMGWDSFGLPAEQYAIRTGTHPRITTEKNIANYRRQLKAAGLSYDWSREFATSDPKFYKWTQWIFTKLYERGLAYEAEMLVNYCPALGTVLANEEVEEGLSKEGGHPVERRPLRQWILKITDYAERLLCDLDGVDWPASIKRHQANWIGRSEGAETAFTVEGSGEPIAVFTTRPDTLFGCSYLVLAPEHPLVASIVSDAQRGAVEEYQRQTATKSDLMRTELGKEKTGVFTGAYALNPVNGEKVPVWVADYVLATYGTGAVMAVPAHDTRDFAFAKKFALPILPVYSSEKLSDDEGVALRSGELCWSGEGVCFNSSHGDLSLDGLETSEAREVVVAWLTEKGLGRGTVNYKLRDWLFSRQRYWGEPIPILHFEDGTMRALELDELPLCPPEVEDYRPTGEGLSPLAGVKEWIEVEDSKTGKLARRESNTMPQWGGSCWYYLRFCDPHNEKVIFRPEAERYWMPVDLYVGGAEHAVLHLLYARFWHKVLFDCGLVSTSEPFQKLFNQGLVTHRSFRRKDGSYVSPDEAELVEGQYVETSSGEPLRSQIEKMSKSKLNVVNPDEMIAEFGADALRLYEMFMGPLDKEKVWNTDGVNGCRRFLVRFFELATGDQVVNDLSDDSMSTAMRLGMRLVHEVEIAIENLQFNVAIARMMEFLNEFSRLPAYPRKVVEMATLVLSPFAPHLAEEVWRHLDHQGSIAHASFPKVDHNYLEEETVTYVVQVNGRLRGRLDLPKAADKEIILKLARENPNVARYLEGSIRKTIFVAGKLINFVVN